MKRETRARLAAAGAMAIFGTIGLLRRSIPLSSAAIALVRGAVGALILLPFAIKKRTPGSAAALKKALPLLLVSGAMIGVNWVLLFEAYRFTSVSVATLCYYMAPVFVIALSPLFLKEKLRLKQIVCAALAVAGMACVSGVIGGKLPESGDLKGILFGLGAAALYAGVVILNKKLPPLSPFDQTAVQLAAASAAVLPYALLTGGGELALLTPKTALLLLVAGAVHTGIAYLLYFGALPDLSGQTAAIVSYIDPLTALVLSALVLREPVTLPVVLGAALILGATLVSQTELKKIFSKFKK